tara:strand:- start:2585 stop:4630 length:2046 start_codon:yes stop_codon:yes gene_type:complete
MPFKKPHLIPWTIVCLALLGSFKTRAEPARLPGGVVEFTEGAKLFSNRSYPVLEVPDSLAGFSFLRTDIESQVLLECAKSFTVYAITPVEHPTNSLANALVSQGFERLEIEPFQLFGTQEADLAGVYRKTLKPGEIVETRKWVVLLAREAFFLKPVSLNWQKNDGEILYNNIQLPRVWPPRTLDPNSYEPIPVPYLEHPPETIDISVGRQLFVDDFLIEETTLKRSWHTAKKDARNPVFSATTKVERKNGVCYLGNGGVFYDPAERLLKMWYSAGELDGALAYATSRDGVEWERPDLGLPAGGNLVLPQGGRTRGDHAGGDNCLWLDVQTEDPSQRLKFLTQRDPRDPHWLATSADGRIWSSPVPAGKAGDYCSFFHNPFRKVWSYSIKRGTKHGRSRYYAEAPEFLTPGAFDRSVFWCGADRLDKPDPEVGDSAQLYSLNAVAYESLIVGAFSIHLGPDNRICNEGKFPKITELKLGFSRDGFHWSRPDRRAFIAASRTEGSWDRAYLHSTGGVFFLDGDELVFPYCGYSGVAPDGRKGMYFGGAIGLARLRRDGFASMDAGDAAGTLTTRPLSFEGSHLFVNVDCPEGELQAELVDVSGQVIEPFTLENCETVSTDSTLVEIRWKGGPEIASLPDDPVRIRFRLRKGSLYSFWFSDTPSGLSDGYLAAGKLGNSSIVDQ